MLKDLFSNRLFIGAFAFFVVCVVGSLLYLRHVEQQSARELAAAEKRVEQWHETQKEAPTVEVPVVEAPQPDEHIHDDGRESSPVVAPQPEVSAPVGSRSRPFDDPYFRMVDGFTVTSQFAIVMAPYDIGPDWASMSAEELADAIETINRTHGMPRVGDEALWPPEGYSYAFGGTTSLSNGDNVWLDDNGYPILKKRGTPFFDIVWIEDFRPPPDVYADYKALHKQYMALHKQQYMETGANTVPTREMERLAAEKKAMEQMYRGRIPSGPITGGVSSPPGMDINQYLQWFHQQFKEIQIQLKRNAYEFEGIAYLMDRYSDLKPYAKLDTYPELKEYAK